MSEHDYEALARKAAQRHGVGLEDAITPFAVSENPTFHISRNGTEPFVLRIYHPGVRAECEIRSELAWMDAIAAERLVPVPTTVAAQDGTTILDVGELGAPIYAVAFTVLPGRELTDDDLPTMFSRLGALTARLHRHARSWTPPRWFSRPRWDLRTTLGDAPHWGPWHASVPDAEQRRQLQKLADVVLGRLRRFGIGPDRFGLIHADLRMANVLADGDALGLIDFDDAGLSWYLYDLGAALTVCEGRSDVDDLVAGWVDEYRRVTPLSEADASEIPTFLMLRRLLVSAFAGHRADVEFAAQLQAMDYNDESCRLAERYLSSFS